MRNTIEYQDVSGNRKVKDTLFTKIFADKKELLDLYNAINGSAYTMTMQNDVSFIFDSNMSLYEHQSTYNPNMPLYPGRLDLAITRAIDECVEENILKDILEASKAEVLETTVEEVKRIVKN